MSAKELIKVLMRLGLGYPIYIDDPDNEERVIPMRRAIIESVTDENGRMIDVIRIH